MSKKSQNKKFFYCLQSFLVQEDSSEAHPNSLAEHHENVRQLQIRARHSVARSYSDPFTTFCESGQDIPNHHDFERNLREYPSNDTLATQQNTYYNYLQSYRANFSSRLRTFEEECTYSDESLDSYDEFLNSGFNSYVCNYLSLKRQKQLALMDPRQFTLPLEKEKPSGGSGRGGGGVCPGNQVEAGFVCSGEGCTEHGDEPENYPSRPISDASSACSKSDHSFQRTSNNASFSPSPTPSHASPSHNHPHPQHHQPTAPYRGQSPLQQHHQFNFNSPQEYLLNHRRVYQSNPASSLSLSGISPCSSPTPGTNNGQQPHFQNPLPGYDSSSSAVSPVVSGNVNNFGYPTSQFANVGSGSGRYSNHSKQPSLPNATAPLSVSSSAAPGSVSQYQLSELVTLAYSQGSGALGINSHNITGTATVPSRVRVTPRRSVSAYRMAVANASSQNSNSSHGSMSSQTNKELLKILAEVFRIGPEKQLQSDTSPFAPLGSSGSNGDSSSGPEWDKVSESLTPISVVLMEETPVCVLHVTGITFPDKKILDSKVFSPGTKITRTTNCFVQWSDRTKGGLWGLNFISEKDALRFVTCCSPQAESPTRVPNNPNAHSSLYPSNTTGQAGSGYNPNQTNTPPSPSRRLHNASPKHHAHALSADLNQFRPSSCVQMEESVHMVGDMLFIKTNNGNNQMNPNDPSNQMISRHNSRQSPLMANQVAHWNNTGMPFPHTSSGGSSRTRSLTPVGGALHCHSLSLSSQVGQPLGPPGSRYTSPVPPQFYPQPSPRSDSPLSVSSNGSCSRHTCGKPLPPGPHRMSSPLPPPSYLQQPFHQYPSNLSSDGSSTHLSTQMYPEGQRSSFNYQQENIYGSINVVPGSGGNSQQGIAHTFQGYQPSHAHSHSNTSTDNHRAFSPDQLPPPNMMYDPHNFQDRSQGHSQNHRRKGSEGNSVGMTIPPHLGPLQTSAPAEGAGSPFLPRGLKGEQKMAPSNPKQNMSSEDAVVYSELFAIMKSSKDSRHSPCSTGPSNTLERASRNNHPILPPRIPTSYPYAALPSGYPSNAIDPDLLSLNDGESGLEPEASRLKNANSKNPKSAVESFGGIPMLEDSKQEQEPSPDTDSPDFNDDLPPPTHEQIAAHEQIFYPSNHNMLQMNPDAKYMNLNIQPITSQSSASGLNRSVISSEGFVSPGSEVTHVSEGGFSTEELQSSKRDSTVSQTDSGFEGHHGAVLSAAGSDNQFASSSNSQAGVPNGGGGGSATDRKASNSSGGSHPAINKRQSNPLVTGQGGPLHNAQMQGTNKNINNTNSISSPAKSNASDSSPSITSHKKTSQSSHPQLHSSQGFKGDPHLTQDSGDVDILACATRRPDSSCGGSEKGSDMRSATGSTGHKGSAPNISHGLVHGSHQGGGENSNCLSKVGPVGGSSGGSGSVVVADGTFFHSSSGAASLDNLTDCSSSNRSQGSSTQSKGDREGANHQEVEDDTVRSFVDCNESLSEDNQSESSEISRHLGLGGVGSTHAHTGIPLPALLDQLSSDAELLGIRSPPRTTARGGHQGDKGASGNQNEGEGEEDNCVDPTDATFRRFGVTRKAGWLEIKHVLFLNSKKKKLETAPKRKWRRYWACLKGHSLLFYSVQTELPNIDENSVPELVLGIENSIAQPIPEHPKRENVFSLSTFHGNVYLCEAQSPAELDNWISAVHSSCANAIVMRRQQQSPSTPLDSSNGGGGGSSVGVVGEEVLKVEQQVDMDLKMKKMAELQLSIMSDPRSRHTVASQIAQWEQNLEQLHCHLYRLKCYAASLSGSELPNPRTLLSAVSKDTKAQLSRLNVFSASSVHAMLSGKTSLEMNHSKDSMVNSGGGSGSLERGRRKMYHQPLSRSSQQNQNQHHSANSQNSGNSREVSSSGDSPHQSSENQNSAQLSSNRNSGQRGDYSKGPGASSADPSPDPTNVRTQPTTSLHNNCNSSANWSTGAGSSGKGKLARVFLPHNQKTVEAVHPQMSVNELLLRCCRKRRLDPRDHFIRIRAPDRTWVIPSPKVSLDSLNCQDIEVCIKEYHAVTLSRNRGERFGIEYETVEEHLPITTNNVNSSSVTTPSPSATIGVPRLFVRDILPGSIAQNGGMEAGDEVLQINGQLVSRQSGPTVDSLLKVDTLHLVIRSLRPSTAPCPQCKTEHLEPDGPNVFHFKRSSFYGEDSLGQDPQTGSSGGPTSNANNNDIKRKSGMSDQSNHSSSGIASACASGPSSGAGSTASASGITTSGGADSSTLTGTGSGTNNGSASGGGGGAGSTMKDATRLGCLIQELIVTEQNYIKDLQFLIETYLEPLLQCSFLIDIEVEAVTSNVEEILSYQQKFCSELAGAVELEPQFTSYQLIPQFKSILIKLSNAFKSHTDHFKLYSAFCANHSKAQRVFAEVKDVPEFRDMLDEKNPAQEHSRSLESFLIKPIQRVLKYPLILREIKAIVGAHSGSVAGSSDHPSEGGGAGSVGVAGTPEGGEMAGEFEGLSSALRAMESVAEHINDMKRIHEQHGPVFEQLIAEQETKYIHELPMDELLMYGSACWANCPEELVPRKMRNSGTGSASGSGGGTEVEVMMFVFKRAVVMLPGPQLNGNQHGGKEKQKKRRLTLPGPEKNKSGSGNGAGGADGECSKVRALIPVGTISLCKEKKDTPSEGSKKFLWELISSRTEFHMCKNQHFQMLSRSNETRRQFVRAIVRCVHDLMKAQQQQQSSRNPSAVGGNTGAGLSRASNERRIRRSNSQHSTRNAYHQNRASNELNNKDQIQNQSQPHSQSGSNRNSADHQDHRDPSQNKLTFSTPLDASFNHMHPYPHPNKNHLHHHHHQSQPHPQLDLDSMPRAIIPTYYPPLIEGTNPHIAIPSQLGNHLLLSPPGSDSSYPTNSPSELCRKTQADSGVFLEESEQHYMNTSSPNCSSTGDSAPFIPPRPMSTVPHGGFTSSSGAHVGSTSTAAALLSPSEFRAPRSYSPRNMVDPRTHQSLQNHHPNASQHFSSRTSAA